MHIQLGHALSGLRLTAAKNTIVKAAFELQSLCVKSAVVRCIYSTGSSCGCKSYKVVTVLDHCPTITILYFTSCVSSECFGYFLQKTKEWTRLIKLTVQITKAFHHRLHSGAL